LGGLLSPERGADHAADVLNARFPDFFGVANLFYGSEVVVFAVCFVYADANFF
jgi:hypothetical protein